MPCLCGQISQILTGSALAPWLSRQVVWRGPDWVPWGSGGSGAEVDVVGGTDDEQASLIESQQSQLSQQGPDRGGSVEDVVGGGAGLDKP